MSTAVSSTRKSMYLVCVCMCMHTYSQSHMLACVRKLLLDMKCSQQQPQGKSTAMQRKAFSDHPDFQKKLGQDYGTSQLGGTLHSIPLHIGGSLKGTGAWVRIPAPLLTSCVTLDK